MRTETGENEVGLSIVQSIETLRKSNQSQIKIQARRAAAFHGQKIREEPESGNEHGGGENAPNDVAPRLWQRVKRHEEEDELGKIVPPDILQRLPREPS